MTEPQPPHRTPAPTGDAPGPRNGTETGTATGAPQAAAPEPAAPEAAAQRRWPPKRAISHKNLAAKAAAKKPDAHAAAPYAAPGFYDKALAAGRHRDIVGGRWEETGEAQMQVLTAAGLAPHHVLLDVGAGSLRLGCRAVEYLEPGHYWATDASRAIMLAGHATELADPARLDPRQLIEDADFSFPGLPETITHAIIFAVFPHLPMAWLRRALTNLARFPALEQVLFTVFLAPDAATAARPWRQPDGVVTHDLRAPYHLLEADVHHIAATSGWALARDTTMLPRGQVLFRAEPLR